MAQYSAALRLTVPELIVNKFSHICVSCVTADILFLHDHCWCGIAFVHYTYCQMSYNQVYVSLQARTRCVNKSQSCQRDPQFDRQVYE